MTVWAQLFRDEKTSLPHPGEELMMETLCLLKKDKGELLPFLSLPLIIKM